MPRSEAGSAPGSARNSALHSPTYLHPTPQHAFPPPIALPPAGLLSGTVSPDIVGGNGGGGMLGAAPAPLRRKRSRVSTPTPPSVPDHVANALVAALQYCCEHLGPSLTAAASSASRPDKALGPHLREKVLRDGAQPVLVYEPDEPLDPSVEVFVLLNCPVEQHPARKNHGQNATVDYPGRYWANFTHLCHLGVYAHASVNNLDKTLRWTSIPALTPVLAHTNFPAFYCKDPIVFYKVAKNNVMVMGMTISRGSAANKTYYDKKEKAYHGDLLPYHIVVRVENAPHMPKTSELPPLPYGVMPPTSRQGSSDSLQFMYINSDSDYTDDEANGETTPADGHGSGGDEAASSLISLLLTANSRNTSSGNLESMAKTDDPAHAHEVHVSQIDLERAAIMIVSDAYQSFVSVAEKLTYASIEAMNKTIVWPHNTLELTQNKLLHTVSSHATVKCLPGLPVPFVGRHELVSQLAQTLLTEHDGKMAHVMWLHGEAGVGKSAVASAVARLCVALNESAFPNGLYYADVAFLRRAHIVNGILSRIQPNGRKVDDYGLNVWAAGLTSRCLVVVDNLERTEKLPTDGLEWLWSWLSASSAHLTVLITSRDPPPATRPSSVASLQIVEQHLDRLSSADAEGLMYALADEADVSEISLAGGIRGPDMITRLAAGVRIQSYAKLRLPSSPETLAPSGAAGLALAVFDGVFDEAAAHAVIGTHELKATTEHDLTYVSAETRASLFALCSVGAIVVVNASQRLLRWSPRWHDVFASAATRVPANHDRALDRLVQYSLLRLLHASQMWLRGQDGAALAMLDHDMPHLSKLLLHTELRSTWLSLLLEVLLAAWPLLQQRFHHREFLRLSERIEQAVVSQNSLTSTDMLLLVAVCDVYANDFDDALPILRSLPQTDLRVLRMLAVALTIQGERLMSEQHYGQALGRFAEGEELLRRAEQSSASHSLPLAMVLEKIATCHVSTGDYHLGLQAATDALERRSAVLGSEHLDTAMSHYNCGLILTLLGDFTAATEHHQHALRIRTAKLGTQHAQTQEVVQQLVAITASALSDKMLL